MQRRRHGLINMKVLLSDLIYNQINWYILVMLKCKLYLKFALVLLSQVTFRKDMQLKLDSFPGEQHVAC